MITKLDIVNACLKTMGEAKLNTLEEDHGFKDDALDLIEQVHADVSAQKLWFNVEILKLVPQADTKFIYVPQDVIKVNPLSAFYHGLVSQRGRRLYDAKRNQYEFDHAVEVQVARLLDFDDLPYEVQQFIRDDVVLRFQGDFDGDNSKYQKFQKQRQDSWINLKAEHIRQIKANPLYSRASVRILDARYGTFGSYHPWSPHTTFPG